MKTRDTLHVVAATALFISVGGSSASPHWLDETQTNVSTKQASRAIDDERASLSVSSTKSKGLETVHRLPHHEEERMPELETLFQREETLFNVLKHPKLKSLRIERNHLNLFIEQYGEVELSLALLKARKHRDTRDIAATLQFKLYQKWEKDVDRSTGAFKLAQQVNARGDPAWQVLEDFSDFLFRNTPKTPGREPFFKTLTSYMDDKKLATIIGKEKLSASTFLEAEKIEKALIKKWLDEKLDPVGLLQRLEMDTDANALVSGSLLTVIKFVTDFNNCPDCAESSVKDFSLVEWYVNKFGYDAVDKALAEAKTYQPSKHAATLLRKELERDYSPQNAEHTERTG
ncbi:hypothetical protein PsorP6_019385 [Peronosclerospora sorghi]|nr:hypothetical protein PsorP6_019385 [Peronosclerospora sorghi]